MVFSSSPPSHLYFFPKSYYLFLPAPSTLALKSARFKNYKAPSLLQHEIAVLQVPGSQLGVGRNQSHGLHLHYIQCPLFVFAGTVTFLKKSITTLNTPTAPLRHPFIYPSIQPTTKNLLCANPFIWKGVVLVKATDKYQPPFPKDEVSEFASL